MTGSGGAGRHHQSLAAAVAEPDQPGPSIDEEGETQYAIEITCKGLEEAHTRSLLLHALSEAGLGLRRLDSEDIPDTSKVSVTAQAVAARRNDGALERVVGRLSLEPQVSGATWQVDRTLSDS